MKYSIVLSSSLIINSVPIIPIKSLYMRDSIPPSLLNCALHHTHLYIYIFKKNNTQRCIYNRLRSSTTPRNHILYVTAHIEYYKHFIAFIVWIKELISLSMCVWVFFYDGMCRYFSISQIKFIQFEIVMLLLLLAIYNFVYVMLLLLLSLCNFT